MIHGDQPEYTMGVRIPCTHRDEFLRDDERQPLADQGILGEEGVRGHVVEFGVFVSLVKDMVNSHVICVKRMMDCLESLRASDKDVSTTISVVNQKYPEVWRRSGAEPRHTYVEVKAPQGARKRCHSQGEPADYRYQEKFHTAAKGGKGSMEGKGLSTREHDAEPTTRRERVGFLDGERRELAEWEEHWQYPSRVPHERLVHEHIYIENYWEMTEDQAARARRDLKHARVAVAENRRNWGWIDSCLDAMSRNYRGVDQDLKGQLSSLIPNYPDEQRRSEPTELPMYAGRVRKLLEGYEMKTQIQALTRFVREWDAGHGYVTLRESIGAQFQSAVTQEQLIIERQDVLLFGQDKLPDERSQPWTRGQLVWHFRNLLMSD